MIGPAETSPALGHSKIGKEAALKTFGEIAGFFQQYHLRHRTKGIVQHVCVQPLWIRLFLPSLLCVLAAVRACARACGTTLQF